MTTCTKNTRIIVERGPFNNCQEALDFLRENVDVSFTEYTGAPHLWAVTSIYTAIENAKTIEDFLHKNNMAFKGR